MTIAIDFDGVIHAYSKGWGDGSIYDKPTPYGIWALEVFMREEKPIFVHTTRNPKQVAKWIEWVSGYVVDCTTRVPRTWYGRRVPFWNKKGVVLVTNWKLAAEIYIDDRGYRFRNWEETMDHLGIENHGIQI